MDDENKEEIIEENMDDKTCPLCGLRQYGKICANCNTPIEEEIDPDRRKEDEYDEYDWRERR